MEDQSFFVEMFTNSTGCTVLGKLYVCFFYGNVHYDGRNYMFAEKTFSIHFVQLRTKPRA